MTLLRIQTHLPRGSEVNYSDEEKDKTLCDSGNILSPGLILHRIEQAIQSALEGGDCHPTEYRQNAFSLSPTMKSQQAWALILVGAIDKSTPLLQSTLEDLESANPADPDTIAVTEL